MNLLPTLPSELIARILSLSYAPISGHDQSFTESNPSYRARLKLLLSAILVNKIWSAEAARLLWKEVVVSKCYTAGSILLSERCGKYRTHFLRVEGTYGASAGVTGIQACQLLTELEGLEHVEVAWFPMEEELSFSAFRAPSLHAFVVAGLKTLVLSTTFLHASTSYNISNTISHSAATNLTSISFRVCSSDSPLLYSFFSTPHIQHLENVYDTNPYEEEFTSFFSGIASHLTSFTVYIVPPLLIPAFALCNSLTYLKLNRPVKLSPILNLIPSKLKALVLEDLWTPQEIVASLEEVSAVPCLAELRTLSLPEADLWKSATAWKTLVKVFTDRGTKIEYRSW